VDLFRDISTALTMGGGLGLFLGLILGVLIGQWKLRY
jgi:hypothetical protein